MSDVQARRLDGDTGLIIRLPGIASRPPRPALKAGEPRGEVLLFTGVRYERQTEPVHPVASGGPGRRRRR